MATVDELVIKIFFDIDKRSFQNLRKLEELYTDIEAKTNRFGNSLTRSEKAIDKAWTKTKKSGDAIRKSTDQAGKGIEKVDKATAKTAKSTGKMVKSTDMLAASFRKVAVAAASALSASSAMRFALNIADDTKKMDDMASSMGHNTSKLMLWGSAMRSAKLDANAFYSDLRGLRDEYDGYSLEQVLEDADFLKDISDKEGRVSAINQAKSMGYGEDSALWLMQGSAAINEALERSRQLGQEVTDEQIENNSRLSKSYNTLAESLENTGRRITGNVAPGLANAFDKITKAVGDNREEIDSWSTAAGAALENIVAGATGDIDRENRTSRFNKESSDVNIRSDDPGIRDSEIQERAVDSLWGMVGNALFTGGEIAIRTAIPPISTLEGKTHHEAILKTLGEGVDRGAKIAEPLVEAYDIDSQMRKPDSGFAPDLPVAPTYKPGGFNANFPKPFESRSNLEKLYQTVNRHADILEGMMTTPMSHDAPTGQRDDYGGASYPRAASRKAAGSMEGGLSDIEELGRYYSLPAITQNINRTPYGDEFDGGQEVVIERQENTFNINGDRMDSHAVANLTVEKIRKASRMSDFAPRRR